MDVEVLQRAALRRHLGLDVTPRGLGVKEPPNLSGKSSTIAFIIERSPSSTKPVKCSLPTCSRTFVGGRYRIAVTPAMNKNATQNADLYHICCLEKIADLPDSDFLGRIEPFTRLTNVRGMHEEHICAGAVERLVLEWKTRLMRRNNVSKKYKSEGQIYNDQNYIYDYKDDDDSDGVEEEVYSYAAQRNNLSTKRLLDDLLHNAGSSCFTPYGFIPGMQRQQYFLLLNSLAPWESDGPGDTEEWNLFDTFLGKDEPDKNGNYPRVSLSAVLEKWETWVEIVLSPDSSLNHEQLKEKAIIGAKGCRAIKRLAVIPMEQIAWQF